MLSYVVHDLETVLGLYEDLPVEDQESVKSAIQSGDGLRVFQDGGLQNEGTGELILDALDDGLVDEDSFVEEAEEAGLALEEEDEDSEDTLGVLIGDLALSCVLAE